MLLSVSGKVNFNDNAHEGAKKRTIKTQIVFCMSRPPVNPTKRSQRLPEVLNRADQKRQRWRICVDVL